MKKAFTILSLSLLIAACGGSKTTSDTGDSTSTANKTATTAESSTAQDTAASHNGTEKTAGAPSGAGAALIASSDCGTCHKENEKVIGPAFVDIAKKYSPATPAIIDTLAHKIINGGSGHWGDVPMAGHPSLPVSDAQTIVKYILSLKK